VTQDEAEAERILGDPPEDKIYYLGMPWLEDRRRAIADALKAARREEKERIAKACESMNIYRVVSDDERIAENMEKVINFHLGFFYAKAIRELPEAAD